jgi:exodeoxyribonuclease VII large subunit
MKVMSVSMLTRYIKTLFDEDEQLVDVLVRGEISNFKRHYSGHCYFTLKDSDSTLRMIMFKSRAQSLKFEPKDGLMVIARGKVTVFERDGQYQFYADSLIPEGMGELSLAFAQLKEKLAAQGLFDEQRKKKLPLLPRTVGVVTSPTGAALRDIITVAKRRHGGIQLILVPVLVQGPEAPDQVARAIQLLNERGGVDVLIVGRGGGSLEELWAFNDEKVVRAIACSTIPVVSAVGHQTDYTLADFVADRRAATPSQAAEFVVPDVKEIGRYVAKLRDMLETSITGVLDRRRTRLGQCRSHRVFQRPEELFAKQRQWVDSQVQQLQLVMKREVLVKRNDFRVAAEKLALLSPLAVLSRGYSITRLPVGRVIRRFSDTEVGQHLEIILEHGKLGVIVEKSEGGVNE